MKKRPVKKVLRAKKSYPKQILAGLLVHNTDGSMLAPTTCGYCGRPLKYRQNGMVFCTCSTWGYNVDDPARPPDAALSGWMPVKKTTRSEKIHPDFVIRGEDGNLWTPTKCGYCGGVLRYSNGAPFCFCSSWNQHVYDSNPPSGALSGWKMVKQKTV